MIEPKENNNIYKIVLLVSIACVLQISETLFPHPVPGIRLGLANIMTLIALVNLGFRPALEVAVLRTLLSSFIIGTFMSPAFILSFAGAVVSTLIMGLFFKLSCISRQYRLSIVGISVMGALSHNIVQLVLAYFIFIKHAGIFVFLPWLCIGAIVMGWLTGVAAGRVCLKLRETGDLEAGVKLGCNGSAALLSRSYQAGESILHRLPANKKIAGIFFLSLLVLVFNNFAFYLALFSLLVFLALFSRISLVSLFSRLKKYNSLVLVAFIFPLFFNSGAHVLFRIADFRITAEGLNAGAGFAFRLLFLILANSLLMMTTSLEDMTRGLSKTLLPLRLFGISGKRTASILSLSLISIPSLGEALRNAVRQADFKNVKNLRNLAPVLSNLIVTLYLSAGAQTLPQGVYFNEEKLVVNKNEVKEGYIFEKEGV